MDTLLKVLNAFSDVYWFPNTRSWRYGSLSAHHPQQPQCHLCCHSDQQVLFVQPPGQGGLGLRGVVPYCCQWGSRDIVLFWFITAGYYLNPQVIRTYELDNDTIQFVSCLPSPRGWGGLITHIDVSPHSNSNWIGWISVFNEKNGAADVKQLTQSLSQITCLHISGFIYGYGDDGYIYCFKIDDSLWVIVLQQYSHLFPGGCSWRVTSLSPIITPPPPTHTGSMVRRLHSRDAEEESIGIAVHPSAAVIASFANNGGVLICTIVRVGHSYISGLLKLWSPR